MKRRTTKGTSFGTHKSTVRDAFNKTRYSLGDVAAPKDQSFHTALLSRVPLREIAK